MDVSGVIDLGGRRCESRLRPRANVSDGGIPFFPPKT